LFLRILGLLLLNHARIMKIANAFDKLREVSKKEPTKQIDSPPVELTEEEAKTQGFDNLEDFRKE